MIVDEVDFERPTAVAQATRMAAAPASWLARVFWFAITSLFLLWLSTATWDFVFGLMERNLWLGRTAIGAAALVCVAVFIFVLRELASFRRLGTLDDLREAARRAKTDEDAAKATAFTQKITRFYRGRSDLSWAQEELAKHRDAVLDPPARVDLAEKTLMVPLDEQAQTHIKAAARQVATATAIVPLPLADVLVAMTANLRMIRQIAEVYGGRAGSFGSWRLLRAVAVHLVATGAIGVADDMIGSVIGGGAVARLSRRFGEGVINGALTVRVGIAAMELCRPMPFEAVKRPGVSALMRDALTGVFGRADQKQTSE